MALLDAEAYEDKYNDPIMGLLKDNTNREIVPSRHRLQITDTKDSFVNYASDIDKYVRSTEVTGTTDYAGTILSAPTNILIGGAIYVLRPASTNTGAVTVNLSSTGAHKLFKDPATQVTTPGEFVQNALYFVMYQTALDGGNGVYLVIGGIASPGAGVSDGDKEGVQVSGSGSVWIPSDHATEVVSTAGGTITLTFDSKERGYFYGSATFATAKDVVFDQDERATWFSFMFDVTNVAATLDFGPDTRAPSNQTAGIFVGGVFTASDVGLHKVEGTKYGDLWLLDFNGVYSVGDAPPETPDPEAWILTTGIWDDTEYWNDGGIWKDS